MARSFDSLRPPGFFSLFARLYARTVFWPTLAWNFLLGKVLHVRRWWDPIDPHVILGAYPFASDVASLRGEGVRAVVNTCEEYLGPVEAYAQHGIEQLHIPTTDFTLPSLDDVEAAVEFIQKYKLQNDCVYIHCKAGRARSATVAMCWLMKYRDMNPAEAQHHLLKCRSHVNRHLTERPVVMHFQTKLAEAKSESGFYPAIDEPLNAGGASAGS
ncbi:MAG: phosphatidylglycerophosphatase and protein-tyrosine phosphatase 1 family protein [Planctomycetota bacterium]